MKAKTVAPFTGAWIEIRQRVLLVHMSTVAPFTGAWIEIEAMAKAIEKAIRRTLHGCVD